MSEASPDKPVPRCAICGKPQDAKFKPFCSRRCTNIDLNRWLKGAYAIPGRPEDDGESGRSAGDDPAPDEGG